MTKIAFLALALSLSATALAQQYKWTDQNGRVQYGDTPPPGVKATRLRGSSAPAPASPASAAKKDAKDSGKPLTPAEQEAAYRKRQADAQKADEKQAQEAQNEQARRDNCNNSRQQLAELESGQRIARTDAKGERYYLEDEQRSAEIARARKLVGDWCK